ncbi:MAG: hypothetical protein HQL69_21575 [Magnetococcales bacterium]|nr:hypothetical protein [Magnetococcales bacterium]
MQQQVPYTNNGQNPVSIGGKTIWPGETRMVDPTQIQPQTKPTPDPDPKPEPEPTQDPDPQPEPEQTQEEEPDPKSEPKPTLNTNALSRYLEQNVDDLTASLSTLTTQELTTLAQLEAADKNRKTALEAIQDQLEGRG